MSNRGWESVAFKCGGCGANFETTSEYEFARLYGEHKATCGPPLSTPLLNMLDSVAYSLRKDGE